MASEQQPPDGAERVAPPPGPSPKRRHGRLATIALGGAVSFVVMSALYGVNQAAGLVGVAVICTAGLGLIPLVFLSWIVGWVLFATWDAVKARSDSAAVS
jgi:hypothetical protein